MLDGDDVPVVEEEEGADPDAGVDGVAAEEGVEGADAVGADELGADVVGAAVDDGDPD